MNALDGEKIKQLRQDKGLTQEDFAEKMKMYAKKYARKEKQGDFNEVERKKLVEILRVPLEMLIKSQNGKPAANAEIDWREKYIQLQQDYIELLKGKSGKITQEELRDLISASSSDLLRFLKVNTAILGELYDQLVKPSEKDKALGAKIEEAMKED